MKGIIRSFLVCVMCCCSAATAQTYVAGTTYMPFQHVGSCGRMIGVDDLDFVHTVWTKLYSPDLSNGERHVFYNLWDPNSGSFILISGQTQGIQVDNASHKAGFSTLALLGNGWVFPALHLQFPDGTGFRSAAAIDLLPRTGIFTSVRIPIYDAPVPFPQILWPKIAVGRDSSIHMVSTQFPDESHPHDPYRIFYSRGTPQWDDQGYGLGIDWAVSNESGFMLMDTVTSIGAVIAASRVSDRIAVAWVKPRHLRNADSSLNEYDNDLYIQQSHDGGYDWNPPENITRFIRPDSACYAETGNALCCSRDTLRVLPDVSLLFDSQDNLHIAFTTIGYYHWLDGTSRPSIQRTKSVIWHWNDGDRIFRPVARSWLESAAMAPHTLPTDHAMVERPSLSLDPANSVIYCAYLKYDTAAYSEAGCLNADVFVSMNQWTGHHWSAGTNVSNTAPAAVPAPMGSNASEQDVSAAERITDGVMHLLYLLERDAGTSGDVMSLNSMIYRRVSVPDSVAATPLMPDLPFHVEIVDCDTTSAADSPPESVDRLELHPAYPNPFNSSTSIVFNLSRQSDVELTVYDILGRESGRLLNGKLADGLHSAVWNPHGCGSGIYFIRLKTAYGERLQKVVYLR